MAGPRDAHAKPPDAIRQVYKHFQKLKPGIGEYHEYAGYFHEIFNEKAQDVPLGDLEMWLQKIDNG